MRRGRVRGLSWRLLFIAGLSLALLSSTSGQTNVQAEVGREVSRIQRPTLFPMVTGEGKQAALEGELPERKEYGQLRIPYDLRPLPWFTAQIVSYRYALEDYTEGPRWDNNHSFALSLIWSIRPWAVARLAAVFVLNDSNIDAFNYNVFTGGPTASLNFQW